MTQVLVLGMFLWSWSQEYTNIVTFPSTYHLCWQHSILHLKSSAFWISIHLWPYIFTLSYSWSFNLSSWLCCHTLQIKNIKVVKERGYWSTVQMLSIGNARITLHINPLPSTYYSLGFRCGATAISVTITARNLSFVETLILVTQSIVDFNEVIFNPWYLRMCLGCDSGRTRQFYNCALSTVLNSLLTETWKGWFSEQFNLDILNCVRVY